MPDTPAPSTPLQPPAEPPAEPPDSAKVYDAFISYKQATESPLAAALRHELHTFAKPWYRLRALRVFLDRTNLDARPHLWASIEAAVRASKHFIYLASPEAAASPWVRQELTEFLRGKRPERLIIILADGEIAWDRAARDFDWARTTAMPRLEAGLVTKDTSPLSDTLYHDARWARREPISAADPRLRDLVATVSSTLRGVPKDMLAGEDVRLRRRALRLAWGAAGALLLLAVGLAVASVWAVTQQRVAVQRLARSYVASGMEMVDEGDPLSALPWLLGALDAEPEGARGAAHRERLGAVLRATPRLVRRWRFDGPVRDAVFSRDGARVMVVTGSEYNEPEVSQALGENDLAGYARVLEVSTGRALTPPLRHRAGISTARFSPDGTRAVTAGADSTAMLWILDDPAGVQGVALRHDGPVAHAEFSGDGRRLLTAGSGVRVWRAADGVLVDTVPLPPEGLHWGTIDSTGARVATYAQRGEVWEVGAPAVRRIPALEGGEADALRFSPDGRRLFVSTHRPVVPAREREPDTRPVVLVLDAASGRAAGPAIDQDTRTSLLELSPDGGLLAIGGGWSAEGGSEPGGLRIWSAASGAPLTSWLPHPQEALSASFSGDGRWLVSRGWEGTARVWSTVPPDAQEPGAARLAVPLTHGEPVVAARFHPGGRHVLTAGGDEVRVWDLLPVEPREAPEVRAVEPAPLSEEARSRDGRWTATLGGPVRAGPGARDVLVTDARRGNRGHLLVFPQIVLSLRMSPDARVLVVASERGSVWIWDLEAREFRGPPLPHGERLSWVEFSPDGRHVATAGEHARVWDLRTGEPVTPLLVHGPPGEDLHGVEHVAFSPDGSRVATASADGTVRVWSTAGGEPVTPRLHGVVGFTWFSADGRSLYAKGPGPEPPLVWSLAPDRRPVEAVRAAVELLSSRRIDETGALVLASRGRTRAP
jgi:WD40 repeat protein